MYETMRKHFYWPDIANDIYITVNGCLSCTRNHRTNKKQKKTTCFPPAGPFDLVTVDVLGSSPKTDGENRYIVEIKDRYSKFTKAIPTAKTTAIRIADIL